MAPDTAAHPSYSVDCPNEPHIGDDGSCWCLGPCCAGSGDSCICAECNQTCGDDHGN